MKGETIEAVMIVKNEEVVLGRCLNSLKGLDKVTILDTGSTDRTAEVAISHGAEYHAGKYKWNDDFAEARNKALEFATCDWILIIDADEILVGGSVEALRKEVEASKPEDLGLRFKCYSAGGLDEHVIIRCHRRRPNIKWAGAIHNYLTWQDGKIAEGVILVYGHSPTHADDPQRAFRILSKVVAANPQAPRETYYLAREYFTRRDFATARKLYERYLPMSKYPPEAADAHLMLARIALVEGKADEAWSEIFAALRINADLSEAYYLLAALSGPINKGHWTRNAKAAGNTLALFVRKNIEGASGAANMMLLPCNATAPGASGARAGEQMQWLPCNATAPGAVCVSAPLEIEHEADASRVAL